jgi:tRNA (guanine-N7-)-methyltransferase
LTSAIRNSDEGGFRHVIDVAARDDAAAFWAAIFGNTRPVEVEIGSGDGTFLIDAATRAPATNFFGIERSPAKASRLVHRVDGVPHLPIRVLRADAPCALRAAVPRASVAAYHVYFPDPWPKRRHARRRLFTPELVATVADTLRPAGRLFTATDVQSYAGRIRATVLADGRFEEAPCPPGHPGLGTAFARKYRAAGRPIYTAVFVRFAADVALTPAASKIRSS